MFQRAHKGSKALSGLFCKVLPLHEYCASFQMIKSTQRGFASVGLKLIRLHRVLVETL